MMFDEKINKKNIINLESLLDFSANLTEKKDRAFIMNSALLSLMGKLKISKGAAFIAHKNKLIPLIVKGNIKAFKTKLLPYTSFKALSDTEERDSPFIEAGYSYCLPVIYNGNTLGILFLGQRITRDPIASDELHYANLVANIVAAALQNAEANTNLIEAKNNVERRNQLLTTMFEMSREFNVPMDRNRIIQMMSYRIMGQLMVSRFGIFLIDENGDYDAIVNRFNYLPSADALNQLSKLERTIKISDLRTCCAIEEYLLLINARIISPMIIGGKTKGIIIIGKKLKGELFTEENIQFIEALANTAVSALENERLFREELLKKQMENDLNIARTIQLKLLPDESPRIPGFELAASSEPSRFVGGDYYDWIKLDDKRLLIVIADVSGKGIPAAIIMANFQAALHSLAPFIVNHHLSLVSLIKRLNELIYQNTESDKFITCFIGILNTEESTFEYVNAGHNPPFIISTSQPRRLTEGGLILGIMDIDMPYNSETIELKAMESLILYTDGVTEAPNESGEEYGEEQLIRIAQSFMQRDAQEMHDSIVSSVKKFSGDVSLYDDLTLLVLKKN